MAMLRLAAELVVDERKNIFLSARAPLGRQNALRLRIVARSPTLIVVATTLHAHTLHEKMVM